MSSTTDESSSLRLLPRPDILSCNLAVKIGQPQSGRSLAGQHAFSHIYSEGFGVLHQRVGVFVETIMADYSKTKTTTSKTVTLEKPASMPIFAKINSTTANRHTLR
ncbi:hypothetical protein AC1031_008068 [Aphanomyces cochlioides]|nr:hypothetical protein AC1031_008068 [Aphanomyces cochlioides]